VSWQLGAMLMLGAMLIAGFAWYERSRPPSQIVALVAALAAIAVAGRIAFSPIPNVVPTTDITLLAGYALGPAPGFAVGALSGLVSNFWLGQGPWTPWQMAGWGMTGVLGAGLALATRRRVGRFGLAAFCAFAGFAYGALLDFSLMVTYGGEQSLDRFLALSARGLPFNIAHAAGNAALALVAGPAMVRMLLRYRRRFEFAWDRVPAIADRAGRAAAGAACVLAALLALTQALLVDRSAPASASPGAAVSASSAGSGAAVSWLRSQQNGDGGFGFGPGEESSPAMTGWAVLGLEAAGINPLDLDAGDATPISYLAGTVAEISTTGDLERTILALRGAGLNPRSFEGHDLVRRLLSRRDGDGSWAGQVNPTAFGILALRAAGAPAGSSRSAAWLRGHENPDGGWGFSAGAASDPDSTGAVLQALAATGGKGTRPGVGYLRGAQQAGGGFAVTGGSANAQSTAWAAQGLLAAGISPSSARKGGRSTLDYLASVQAGDGHYRYSASSDQTPVWVTGQALMAVNEKPFPLAPVPRRTGRSARVKASGPGSTAGAATGASPAPGGKGATGTATQAAPTTTTQPSQTAAVPLSPASSSQGDGSGGGVPAWLLPLAAAAALAAGVWGGWLYSRRRLPN
jgi:energy-coupling factor transport system substrate-specific component